MFLRILMLITSCLTLSELTLAEGLGKSPVVQKIGGDYEIHAIKKIDSQSFRIEFIHKEKDGPYKRLFLVSDHVHLGLKEGMILRISGQVKSRHKEGTELSQVLLFLPSDYGKVPVWMLSKNSLPHSLKGAKFLDMHAPSADFYLM